jgi:carbamoyltransferase
MEFGARALGNRSILANPGNWKTVKVINEMIKMRDFWMPFAPSMLSECALDYIHNPKYIKSPYMVLAFETKKDKLDKIIASVHPYDHSCRPQVVEKKWNPDYHRLINYYRDLTGEGAILNTSLNLHGFPIVYKPTDALEVFDKSGLRYLALGNVLIEEV